MKNNRKYKILDNSIILLLSISVVIFILLPFVSVFKEALIIEDKLDLSFFINTIKSNIDLLKNTLKLGLLTSILSLIASSILSVYIYLSSERAKKIFLILLLITLISPPFVTSLSFINLFGRRGLISYRLLGLRLNPYGLYGIVFMQVISDLSLNSLLLYSSLKNIDHQIIDSARSLGASTTYIIKDILLPGLGAGIGACAVLSFFRAISDFSTPTIIGGSYNVLASESYFAVIAQGDLKRAAALNLLMLIPSILVYAIYIKKSASASLSSISISDQAPIKRAGLLYNVIRLIAGILMFILAALYFTIILSSFTKMELGNLTFSLQNFVDTKPYINGTLIRSIGYSLIAATVGSFVGLLIGYYLKIRRIKFMKFVDFSASLPYIIPGTFFGLGYLLFFKNPPIQITGTALIVILNVTFKQLPFSSKVSNAAMEGINSDILNSIRDLGGSHFHEIKDAILPLSKDALGVSFINAFRSTMTTIGSIIFLVYPSRKLLTLVMFDAIASGKYQVGSVIALLIIVTCLIFYAIYYLIARRNDVFTSKKSDKNL
ncbi:MAG: iron ABC transporter permease [Finegoldia sp.]|nr:iron ABC transporter permease [Finegoldia sp.]